MINLTHFKEEVYAVIAAIPRGKVITYGQIAWLIGMPRHARLVGRMLHEATNALNLPCHRVVNSPNKFAASGRGHIPQKRMCGYEGLRLEVQRLIHSSIHRN